LRRKMLLLAGILLPFTALGSDTPKEHDDATQAISIEGTWQRTDFVFKGRKLELPYQSVLTLRDGTYTRCDSNGDTLRGTYRIVASHDAGHLDWTPSNGIFAGQTLKFTFQSDGDTFREAGLPDSNYTQRPQGFKDKGVEVATYKRVK